jgi:hypothetical protein
VITGAVLNEGKKHASNQLVGFEKYTRKTCKELFPEEMVRIVPGRVIWCARFTRNSHSVRRKRVSTAMNKAISMEVGLWKRRRNGIPGMS